MKGMVFIRNQIIAVLKKFLLLNKTVKMVALSLLCLVVAVIGMMIGGIGFEYDVIFDGERIGRISDLSVYGEAKSIATSNVVSADGKSLNLSKPKLKYSFSFAPADITADQLSTYILDHSDNIVQGYSVEIDGTHKLYVADRTEVDNAVNARCESFKVEGEGCESYIEAPINFVDAFIDSKVISNSEEITKAVNELVVTTVANEVSNYEIKYETKTNRTSSKAEGYKSVTTKGVNGVVEKVEKVTYHNGVQVASDVVLTRVVTAPVNEIITVGTGRAITAYVVNNSSAKGFIWPLAIKGKITSYWGDGRNHKGIDIAAPQGTDTYAVKAGKVEFAGWNRDYGYTVIIDHGNGVKTRTAHHSKLYVKTGQSVIQGQVIAAVGTTGQSTGNHCHFEVMINGTRVNPAPYLGI